MRGLWARLMGRHEEGRVRWEERTEEVAGELLKPGADALSSLATDRSRPFFSHELRFLPRAAPDGLRLASSMARIRAPRRIWQVLLHAKGPVVTEFPPDLFFDDDVIWHRQHLDRPGHVAYASLALRGDTVYGLTYISDLVQRISRRKEHKTRVSRRFQGWPNLLLNGVLAFALARGKATVRSPTADWVLEHTDPTRTVNRELFDRVYDRTVHRLYQAHRTGRWWIIDVEANRDRIVLPTLRKEPAVHEKTICVCHDVERGWGHGSEPTLQGSLEQTARKALPEILRIERELEVPASYSVVGRMVPEVREKITRDGHALAFHSYDHNLGRPQLARCRDVDYRIRGYRAPQSRITRELRDRNLAFHNFEWIAASVPALGVEQPVTENRVAKIPIHFDDYDLHTGRASYGEWERRALEIISTRTFVAFGLHDCYASHWLPHFRDFLRHIAAMGRLRTLDQVCDDLFLAGAARIGREGTGVGQGRHAGEARHR